ncbi:MAG: M48 family peptidase [Planctomycetes bacterium]|nr:M48 family peptidase [Planctomycetota bacterium]
MATRDGITARERANMAAQSVLRVWESGQLPGLIAQSVLASKADLPCAKWSLGNRLLMLVQGTADARGFQQWKEVERNVRKGSKAIYILGPVLVKRDKADPASELALIGFRGIPVFRFEDTEGQPLEVSSYTPEALPPLQEVAQRIGVQVSYTPALADFMGRYLPGRKAIELCTHDSATWFHELSHAVDDYLGSMKRAKSKSDAAYKDGEVVAEFCAAALAKLYGIEYEHNALRYIERYRQDAAKAVTRLLSRIEAVLAFILESEAVTETMPAAIAA